MFGWLKRRSAREASQARTAADWYSYYRSPQYFQGDLPSAVTAALRDVIGSESEPPGRDVPSLLSVLLTTDSREAVRCLAAVKMGVDKHTACEGALLAALHGESETVRRTVALALVALDTVRGLAAVVAGSRHGHGVRTEAAHRLRAHGPGAAEAIPGLLKLLSYRDINWRSHAAAAGALTAIGESAIPWLRQVFESGEAHIRYYAAMALKDMNKTPELLASIDAVLAKHRTGE
jgi:HEAT repeat protein